MFYRFINYWSNFRDRQRINIALSKGSAMMNARRIDLTHPETWEFSGFSQNGEDGILDVLRSQLISSNRYFIEIGTSDGIENNSAWLLIAEKYSGIMIEGDSKLAACANRIVTPHSIGGECLNMFVTCENIHELKKLSFYHDPDVFSLDIDGNDYYIAKAILDGGFRPKIFVVEYNSVFGEERSSTIEYQANFVFTKAHSTHLYYGVSISGWRKFFASFDYRFITVDRNGVNGFFVAPEFFEEIFLDNVKGLMFAENRYQYKKFRASNPVQFALIADQKFINI